MRIDPNLGGLAGLQSDANVWTATRQKQAEHSFQPEDVAELSCDGVSISDLSAKAMAAPEIRSDRVNSLRQQIVEGTYQPDPKQIASAMIDNLLAR
jgi:flagellar biosynthesis anti-sigma factor FlgM